MRIDLRPTGTSQIAARLSSISMPLSAMLVAEPTLTYSDLPSGLATTFLAQ